MRLLKAAIKLYRKRQKSVIPDDTKRHPIVPYSVAFRYTIEYGTFLYELAEESLILDRIDGDYGIFMAYTASQNAYFMLLCQNKANAARIAKDESRKLDRTRL